MTDYEAKVSRNDLSIYASINNVHGVIMSHKSSFDCAIIEN